MREVERVCGRGCGLLNALDHVPAVRAVLLMERCDAHLVDLEDSLAKLASLNERHARMVELRLLGGLTIDETAAALEVSQATVERDWVTVRAWLRRELGRTA